MSNVEVAAHACMRRRLCAWSVMVLSLIGTPALADPLLPPSEPPHAADRGVIVHLRTRDPARRAYLRLHDPRLGPSAPDGGFERLCSSPCDRTVPPGSTLRITMEGARDREIVLTPGHDGELDIEARSDIPSVAWTGLGLAIVGSVLIPVGWYVAHTEDPFNQPGEGCGTTYTFQKPCTHYGTVLLAVGIGAVAAGLVVFAVLAEVGRNTNVETRRPVVPAPTTRTAALRVDGDERTRASGAAPAGAPFTLGFTF